MGNVAALRRSVAICRQVEPVRDAPVVAVAAYPGASLSTGQLAVLAEATVGDAFAVTELYLRGKRRGARRLAHARTIAMALVHLVAGRSQEDVAAAFKRNRTTASNHMEMVEALNDVPEHEACWDLMAQRFELLIRLKEMPPLRPAWMAALRGLEHALESGDYLEGDAVDQARHVTGVFWEDRIDGAE